jgi:predicted DNA-binding protein
VIIVRNKKKKSDYRFILKKKKKSGEKIQISIYVTQDQDDKANELSELSGHSKSYIYSEAFYKYYDRVEIID